MGQITTLHILLLAAALYILLSILVRLGYSPLFQRFMQRPKELARRVSQRIPSGKRKRLFPVRYVASRRHSLFRLIPWDASGTLTASEKGFHFEGSSPMGKQLEFDIDPNQATINYQKGKLWWDGGVSWCVIESKGEKHFFTSEVQDAEAAENGLEGGLGTTDIYQHLTNRYIKIN